MGNRQRQHRDLFRYLRSWFTNAGLHDLPVDRDNKETPCVIADCVMDDCIQGCYTVEGSCCVEATCDVEEPPKEQPTPGRKYIWN